MADFIMFILNLFFLFIAFCVGIVVGGSALRAKLFGSVKLKVKDNKKLPQDDRFVSGFDAGIRWALREIFPKTWDKVKLKLEEDDTPEQSVEDMQSGLY